MKRFILEKPHDKNDKDLEVWVCDKHYEPFLKSNKFQKLAKEYDCIMILEGVVQGIPHMCWCCAQNDGDDAGFLTYHGDAFLCQAI